MIRRENLALIVALLAMIGTLGNFLFGIWTHQSSKKTELTLVTTPMLDEYVDVERSEAGDIIIHTLCSIKVTNTSSKDIYISDISSTCQGSIGTSCYGIVRSQEPPYNLGSLQKVAYVYDNNNPTSLNKISFPLKLLSKDQRVFIVKINLPIGKDIAVNKMPECKVKKSSKIIARNFIKNCLGLDTSINGDLEGFGDFKVKYKTEQKIGIMTTEGEFIIKSSEVNFGNEPEIYERLKIKSHN